MPAVTQTRTILVKVDTKNATALQEIADKFGILNKNTKNLSSNMGFLTGAFRGWLGFLGVREITRMSDSMQNLSNRFELITGSVTGAKEAMAGVAAVADRTNQGIEGTGQVFSRLALSVKGSGANTKELLALTETLTNSFRVAGATTTETTNTIIQLSQAFSSGQLRGQELRSVMEQNATLAALLKKRFGNDIYKEAEKGTISITEVLKILAANQKQINADAAKLAPTFEQTLTKASNKLSIAIGDLNKQFGLSSKFAAVMDFAVNHLVEILTVAGGAFTVFAAVQVPAMVASLNTLRLAFLGFAAANPVLLILTAVATAGLLIYENWSKLGPLFNKVKLGFLEMALTLEEAGDRFLAAIDKLTGADTKRGPNPYIGQLKKDIEELKKTLSTPVKSDGVVGDDTQKSLDSFIKKLQEMDKRAKKAKELLAILNEEYGRGAITIEQYVDRLKKVEVAKLTEQFKDGKIDVFKYHDGLKNLALGDLNVQLKEAKITMEQFNQATADTKLAALNEQLKGKKLTLAQYNEELTKLNDHFRPGAAFYTGIDNFINNVGNLSQGVARVTTQAFDHLSNTLTDFIIKGKADFGAFAEAVARDVTNMLIRVSIVRPIAQGILGLFGSGAELASTSTAAATASGGTPVFGFNYAAHANGGVMTSDGSMKLNKYSSGGIANSPQLAMFGEGRTPEAYVPLPDGRSIPVKMDNGGGVNFSQTIIINSDGSATTSESGGGKKAKELSDLMKRAALDTIIQQQRPGGLLARG